MIKRIYKWAIVIACIYIFATACDSRDPYYYPYEDWAEKMGEYTKLTVLKTANVDSFSGPDEQIEYTITITNSGEIALHHQIDVIDNLIDLECENDYVQPFSEHTLTEFRWEDYKYNWKSLTMLIQTFSATDEEIKSFVCKQGNINS